MWRNWGDEGWWTLVLFWKKPGFVVSKENQLVERKGIMPTSNWKGVTPAAYQCESGLQGQAGSFSGTELIGKMAKWWSRNLLLWMFKGTRCLIERPLEESKRWSLMYKNRGTQHFSWCSYLSGKILCSFAVLLQGMHFLYTSRLAMLEYKY